MTTQRFVSYDGTMVAYQTIGRPHDGGRPLVCVPGGPARGAEYLGDLGGLSGLVILHNRGTGGSDRPADKDGYRADKLAEDIEALRVHLGLSQMDLLGHSVGAAIALIYAARYPQRIGHLVLVAPALMAAGFTLTFEQWLESVEIRRDEPWFEEAVQAARSGAPAQAYAQFMYGRWDETTQAHSQTGLRDQEAADGFRATDWEAVSPQTVEGLRGLDAPVLIVVGELDPAPTPGMALRFAEMLRHGEVAIQPKAGHFPWIDDPEAFTETTRQFLAR